MGKVKRKKNISTDTRSPVVLTASKVKRKYRRGFPKSPSKESRAKKALFEKSLHTSAEVWIKNSVIKGYHVYEIRPPMNLTDSPTRLPVDLEYTNITDQHASLVWIPELTYFPTDLHNVTTDVKRNLKLSDIAGLPVGHAPRGLSFAFRQLIENNCQIHAMTIGEPCPSFPPWPPVMEKGGGVVIPCDYVITCSPDIINYAKEIISNAIGQMPERNAMALEVT